MVTFNIDKTHILITFQIARPVSPDGEWKVFTPIRKKKNTIMHSNMSKLLGFILPLVRN